MKFTKIPSDTFKQIQLNAGVIASDFTPATGELTVSNIIGATTGGTSFEATPTYTDFGEDIDNCPVNMKELKQLESWEVIMSGTFVTITTASAKRMIGLADIDSSDPTHVVPRNDVLDTDFQDLWWIGDYSDDNTDENGGFIAIHLLNSLSTGGFKLQSDNKTKGNFEFEFTGHYSMEDQDKVPFEIYIKAGGSDNLDADLETELQS